MTRARRSVERHEHHRAKPRARAATPSPEPPKVCATSGCRKLTQRSAGDGFSARFCRDCMRACGAARQHMAHDTAQGGHRAVPQGRPALAQGAP